MEPDTSSARQPAPASWLDILERGVERRVQRVDQLWHGRPRALAALTLALGVGLERRRDGDRVDTRRAQSTRVADLRDYTELP